VRRQITLLVAATTSIVLLAFLLPAASLVARVAEARALDAGQAQLQFLVPTVGLDTREQVAAALVGTSGDLDVGVRWTDGEWLGVPGPDTDPTSPTVEETDAGTRLVQPVRRAEGTAVVDVFIPAEQLRAGVTRTRLVLAALGAVLLLLALVVADRLARSLTRPVTDLAATAHRLGSGDLDARATPSGPGEVREVATALNRLADRIGQLLAAERESAADLAHRLRTPLTALRLDAEAHPDVELARRIGEDVAELERQVDRIIREARQGSREAPVQSVDLAAIVRDRVSFWSALAEDQGRSWSVDTAPGLLPVKAHPDELVAAIDALIGNVFSHTDEAVGFWVWAGGLGDGVVGVRIEDAGPGFPGDDVVERGESQGGSTGLGLDIARRTAVGAGGAIRLAGSPHGGALVELSFARADVDPTPDGA